MKHTWLLLIALAFATSADAQTSGAQATQSSAAREPTPAPIEIDLGTGADTLLGATAHASGKEAATPTDAPAAKRVAAPKYSSSQFGNEAAGVEHVEFKRRPIRVVLAVGRERLLTFPGPVALHIPSGADSQLRLETIGRTSYVTALSAFGTLRIVAEDLERDGMQYPVDLVAQRDVRTTSGELEIHAPSSVSSNGGATVATKTSPEVTVDMVQLTRYAARMLYAPRRLMPATPGIRQVPLSTTLVPGLYRGARVATTPIGAWRGGGLYVTAVRISNLELTPVELDLDELRGGWLASTAQHLRLAPAGDEADTTAIYLICDRPFETCR